MAYDEELAERLREALAGTSGISEQRMFGGLGFLVDGRLAIAASGQGGLLVRVAPGHAETLLGPPRVRRYVMRGREMADWLGVTVESVEQDDELRRWADVAVAAAQVATGAPSARG